MSCCCNSLYTGIPCCCPPYTTTTTTFQPCEDGEICNVKYTTDCVIYNGEVVTFNCLTINPGDNYTEILEAIISNLAECTTTTTTVLPTTTTTSTTSTTTSTTSTTTSSTSTTTSTSSTTTSTTIAPTTTTTTTEVLTTTSTTTAPPDLGVTVRLGYQSATTDGVNIVFSTDGGTSWNTWVTSPTIFVLPSRNAISGISFPIGTNVAFAIVPTSNPLIDISYGVGSTGTDVNSLCGISTFYEILNISSNQTIYFNVAVSGGNIITCP